MSHWRWSVALVLLSAGPAMSQSGGFTLSQATPSQDVEQVVNESTTEPDAPLSPIDRPFYRALKQSKQELEQKYGFTWAVEDTYIYQTVTPGPDTRDAMVNTLGLFSTWKILRSDNGKDFAGLGFQAETRGNFSGNTFGDMTADLGTIWSVNDSTSDDYTKINQLWWGQKFDEGKYGYLVGKIDPGSRINGNRFAGSGNTQFFGQPYATNPARSFPDNGLGFMLHADPVPWGYAHFTMSDSDAVSTYSPFKTIDGHWFYAGEVGYTPRPNGLEGNYRLMLYYRDTGDADETGWSLSCDQNLSEKYGVFLRYGGNDGGLNQIRHLVSGGLSWLQPFERKNDQAGVGLSYTHPDNPDFRDEYASEVYYRLQVTDGFELSASVQLIVDPSTDESDDVLGVFGVRARILY